ncbi:MAG: chemotaxis protein CheA [Phenylobacterium sp.]
MDEFLQQFLTESRELVEQATEDLLALEQAPEDAARLDSAFRAFHTLKGAAGIIEFPAMGRLLHAAEDVLSGVRAGDRPVTIDLVSHCLSALDQVIQWLDVMEISGAPPTDADAAADRLAARFAPNDAPAAAESLATAARQGPPPWVEPLLAAYPGSMAEALTALRYVPDTDCFFRGDDPLALMAGAPGLLALRLSPSSPWPALDDLDPFACNLVIEALLAADEATVANHLRAVSDQLQLHPLAVASGEGQALSPAARAILQAQIDLVLESEGDGFAGTLGAAGRVAASVLRQAGLDADTVAAALVASLASTDPSAFADALRAVLDTPKSDRSDAFAGPVVQEGAAQALRVDVDRIDAIIKLTGELTVVKNALGHAVRLARDGGDIQTLAQALKEQHGLLERLTVELQRSVVAIRVLPLRHVFQRFSRLVREMSVSLGRPVRLVVEGETTEADKAVVEALFEPLLHVIRNALDHGVEDPAARRSAGKPETAVIHMRGVREGERVIVEVRDDGRGIDPARIRLVAAERGLLSAEALEAISDENVVDLIFAPGFSTAEVVTNLSGRGVGMDAVRATIERLGGRVAVETRKGEGTTIRFSLPFTVMMTRVMTVEAGGQVFGVPFEAVVETLRIPRSEISRIGAAEAFVLRGQTVPLVGLAQTLGLDAVPKPEEVKAVVTAVGGRLSALQVDAFGERLDVMLKPMDGLLAGMQGVAGATLMGDGRVLIVLDLGELLL